MSKFLLFSLPISFVQAYSEFFTTCTTPSSPTNYVSSPDTRGTLDILWSCFFTIIACTWTIQHLNVPEQSSHDSQGVRWYQFWKWNLKGLKRSLKWMFVTIIAPEYILGKAVADLYAAHHSKKQMRRYARVDEAEWGLTHAFFANMGGFVLTQKPREHEKPPTRQDTEAPDTIYKDVEKEAVEYEPIEVAPSSSSDTRIMDNDSASRKKLAVDVNEEKIERSPRGSSDKESTKPDGDNIPPNGVETMTINPLNLNPTRPLPRSKNSIITQTKIRRGSSQSKLAPFERKMPFMNSESHRGVAVMPSTIVHDTSRKALTKETSNPASWGLASGRKDEMGLVMDLGNNTFASTILKINRAPAKYKAPFHLLASEIFRLRLTGALPNIPKIASSEIVDKSKGDSFIKLITAFQVLWFILQVIVRAVRQLSISQLEIAVTAFGVCAILTYFLLLPKPKGVEAPITFVEFEGHIPIEQRTFEVLHHRLLQGYVQALFVPGVNIINYVDVWGSHIPNDAVDSYGKSVVYLHFGVAIGGVIFGAIHIAAWNLSFPTSIEQTLWRAASIMSTVLLPVMYVPLLVNEFFHRGRVSPRFIKIWDLVFGSLYVVARAFLLVEIFRTLFYLPEDAYLTTWAASLPHVA